MTEKLLISRKKVKKSDRPATLTLISRKNSGLNEEWIKLLPKTLQCRDQDPFAVFGNYGHEVTSLTHTLFSTDISWKQYFTKENILWVVFGLQYNFQSFQYNDIFRGMIWMKWHIIWHVVVLSKCFHSFVQKYTLKPQKIQSKVLNYNTQNRYKCSYFVQKSISQQKMKYYQVTYFGI